MTVPLGTWSKAFSGWRWSPWFLTLIVLLGILMLADATHVPVWMDECLTAQHIGSDWMGLIRTVGRSEHHPLFYFLLLKLWTSVAGTSPVALRSMSIVFWGLAIAGMVALQRQLWDGEEAPLLGGALLAFSPCMLWHSWNARPYELVVALEVWAAVFYVRTFFATRLERRDYLLFLLTMLGGLTTLYHFLVPAMLMFAAALAGPRRRLAVWSAVGLAVAGAVLLCPLLARQGFRPGWIPLCTWTTPFTTLAQFFTPVTGAAVLIAAVFSLWKPPHPRVPIRSLLVIALGVWLVPPTVGHFAGLFWPPRQGILLGPWLMSLLSGPLAARLGKPGIAMLVALLWASAAVTFIQPLTLGPTYSEYQVLVDCTQLESPGDILLVDGAANVTVEYYFDRLQHQRLRWVGYDGLASALLQETPHHIFRIGEADDPLSGWLGRHFRRTLVLSYIRYDAVPPDRQAFCSVLEVYSPRPQGLSRGAPK